MAPAVPTGRPWRAGWVVVLGAAGGLVFTLGLLVQARCAVGRCPAPAVQRLFGLDAVGSLPRLFTTAVFVLVAVLAWAAARRTGGRVQLWWSAVAAGAVVLALAKAVSAHSSAEQDSQVLTLVAGVALGLVGLPVLLVAGLRWSVAGAAPVTGALAAYAVAALGLDQVTSLVVVLFRDPVLLAFAVYLEEGGEAVTAVVLLAAVLQAVPRRP
ncbi:hypothetical protein DMO24_02740 [Modestobacter versicolor]|uniref:Uncharacterized protein n=1 Tax=Modestobacter versicolor TaxID=429133 RepID=A0A323VFP2_9ACTN|nr:hypothetical protein DMO24_02740 [Modestobacter versicolor]